MSQDCDQRYEESFNSFLAGVLLTRSCVENFEFFNLMNSFQKEYNVDIVSTESEICVPIYFDDDKIRLSKTIDDKIFINGKKIIIRDYLYSISSFRVREFFQISDLKKVVEKKSKSFMRLLSKNKSRVAI